ncbi:Txe/YoeB family addiction module toxin [Mucilaginibacter gilvus]|uniref:Putative mRNA interferase YoeB n=1 Tax=Mucilaginibacter gilvus TaxID=2305909 RepID=A0A3S3XCV4_9SPHI|nr:Txe/YoeB family addiction module toxin [Mucilaginibacter gilvus]RWY55578.1 Txe/YoeB family addiction module toxin [Mucilaginibacter gilvus]
MEVILASAALSHLKEWQKSGNVRIQNKINQLLYSIMETPFEGIGKPEPLKHQLSGKWSRRIDQEHRIVYAVDGNILNVYSLKGHY